VRLLGVFAKAPRPGEAKTRLIPQLGAARAARVAEAFLRDTVERCGTIADGQWLCNSPDDDDTVAWFQALGGSGWSLWPQPSRPLGERLSAYFAAGFAAGYQRVVALGADSPTLPRELLERAFAELQRVDCVLGPATDGGYYLIGLSRLLPGVFAEIEFSTPRVLGQTVTRLTELGGTLAVLSPWYDVDSPDDLELLRGHLAAQRRAGQGGECPETEHCLSPNTPARDVVI